jgi:hypothetical protein
MSPIVTTSNTGQNNSNASFSMLFSPAASSLASTPGGPLNLNNTTLTDHHANMQYGGGKHQQQQQQVELEVDWDPATVQAELLQATCVLSHRGLKLAAKWAAEQLVGIRSDSNTENSSGTSNQQQQQQQQQHAAWSHLTSKDWYAKSLVDLGEYLHAAYVLSDTTHSASEAGGVDILQIPGPSSELSTFGVYLRAYALYMAGERRKEEDHLELQR